MHLPKLKRHRESPALKIFSPRASISMIVRVWGRVGMGRRVSGTAKSGSLAHGCAHMLRHVVPIAGLLDALADAPAIPGPDELVVIPQSQKHHLAAALR